MDSHNIAHLAHDLSVDIHSIKVKQLHGDASHRIYWRVSAKDKTWIVSQQAAFAKNDDFLVISKYLSKNNIPVPTIIKTHPEAGIILMEDLGDDLLYHVAKNDLEKAIPLYEQAIDLLVRMQTTLKADKSCPAFKRAFDKAKWLWELEHAENYLFKHMLGNPFSSAELRLLRSGFDLIASNISLAPLKFSHRDFHSRNFLYHNNELRIIDYQDARLGPPLYDLVSILRDCYIQLPTETEKKLISRYRSDVEWKEISFEEQYLWTAVQRHLKACGTFAYQYSERKNLFYLQFIRPTWNMIMLETKEIPELDKLHDLLKKIALPEIIP